ncbi:MAG: nucleotidyltransferase, partial [Spirosomaceae bacterium]|nr:nucleotidyltransferase [Spirosomataceae bacterium]
LEAYEKMAKFLSENTDEKVHSMVGYQVKNTLSDNGSVSRGVCQTDKNSQLIEVIERTKIMRKASGEIVFIEGEEETLLDENATVSMNFWGFKPNVFPVMKSLFEQYAEKNFDSPKAEFYIPTVMSHLIEKGLGSCQVFDNASNWFGVTYPEDKTEVTNAISELVNAGNYPAKLWD